jgi:alginate O-acetyltransferase complex protein AlgI
MSLSSWLRDYLYIPLGGNRKGAVRTYVNLMIVMLLGGLWHGASIAFVIWGAWHGALLAIERASRDFHPSRWLPPAGALALTQLLVIVSWVPFRADSWERATVVLDAMFLTRPSGNWIFAGLSPLIVLLIPFGFALCWFVPNTWELLERGNNVGYVRDFLLFAVSIAVVLANQASPFLYFQF